MKHTLKACALAFALLLASPPAVAQTTNFLMSIFVPPKHYMQPVFREWAKQVESATDGRVKFSFAPKPVAPPNKQYEAVINGVADGAFQFNGFLANKAQLPLMSHLPWTYKDDSVATSVALWRTYDKFFRAADEHKEVEVLSIFTFAGGTYCSLTDKPILSVEDLRNRKMWALPGTAANLLKNMDVAFVSGPAVKIHELVSRNVVEGYTGITFNSIVAFKASPYTKSCLLFDKKINNSSFTLFVNKEKFNSLSAADQAAMRSLSGEKFAAMSGKAVNAAEVKRIQEVADQGIELIPAPAQFVADLEKAGKPLIDAWYKQAANKGVDGKAALSYYLAELDKVGS